MYIDYLSQDSIGFTKLPDGRYFFRTSSLVALLQCPYKINFIAKQNNSDDFMKSLPLVKGKVIHAAVSYLLEMYKYGLAKEGAAILDKFIDNQLNKEMQKYTKNLPDTDFLENLKLDCKNASLNFARYTVKNYNSIITEKTIIIEKDSFVLKLTPDLITEHGIVDYKTTKKQLTSNFYISYDYALQMAVYSHYLQMDAQLLFYSFADGKLLLKKPGKFNNVEERILRLIDLLENNKLYKNQYACSTCFYKNKCTLEADTTFDMKIE